MITGADRGLGLALVQEYLKRGDRVFAGKYGKNWHLLEKLKESFPDALSIVDLDVRSNESVAKAADFILANTNAIDILINNAAVWKEQNT